MKHVKLILALFALALAGEAQQYTGQITYNHSGLTAILSSGTYVSSNPGFVMAGYEPTVLSTTNFIVDKVDQKGVFSGSAGEFASRYKVNTGGLGCSAVMGQETNCYGISIIENTVSPTRYALTGAFGSGCVFATLNNTGGVIDNALFPFPNNVTLISKPSIAIDPSGEFYITGSYVIGSSIRYMYVLKLKFNGALLWSKTYDLGAGTSLQSNAIIVAPASYYANPTLAVVGIADFNATVDEGFLMTIDAGTGNVGTFTTVGSGGATKERFFSIAPADGLTGYIIGATSDISQSGGQSWMLRMKTNGAMDWSSLITASNGVDGKEVFGVIERFNTYSTYEYYGTAPAAGGGMYVFKLDDTGTAFVNGSNTNSEFLYDHGGGTSRPAAISYVDGNNVNIGIHVFGTTSFTPGDFYLTQACFNGASANCPVSQQVIGSIGSITTGPSTVASPNVNVNTGLSSCTSINVSANSSPYSPSPLCNQGVLPTTPVPGLNSRTMATAIKTNAGEASAFSVYPNPVSNAAQINYTLHDGGAVKIDLYNSLGQHIKTLDKGYKAAGSNTVELDLGSLGVQSGVYLINVSTNGTTSQQKIIYNKD